MSWKNALKIHYPGKEGTRKHRKKGLEGMSKNTYLLQKYVVHLHFEFNTYVVCVAFVPTALAVTLHIGQNFNIFVQIMGSSSLF